MADSSVGNELHTVDPSVWKACAGSSVQIAPVGSRVYYFPQGHAEQAWSLPEFSSRVCLTPWVHCRIVAVQFLANRESDEVFSRIRLEPIDPSRAGISTSVPVEGGRADEFEEDKIVQVAKILTPSDANNGGGFSVPRFCADVVFPPLNFNDDPPVQTLSVRDVHGAVWEFRHIYRGTPRRHLLTTGWSKFVNSKKLVAGDSAVFMKNRRGELFVGIRRTGRSIGCGDSGRWSAVAKAVAKMKGEFGGGEIYWRSGRGRVSAKSVVEAAELAIAGKSFEIVYYPRAGLPDFVINAEKVEEAMNMSWTAGMGVRMAVETEDSSKLTWYQGTVSVPTVPAPGPWSGSPWRMLQVTWNDPNILQNAKRVSPWDVQLVVAAPPFETSYTPTKRLRVSQNPELLNNEEEGLLSPMTGLTNSMMEHMRPSLCNNNIFPAGMQGARHDPICSSSVSNFVANSTYSMSHHLFGNTPQKSDCVSTELNVGGTLQSDNSSPHSQGSVHFFGKETIDSQAFHTSTKVGITSFKLFGNFIQVKQPVESDFDYIGCTKDDGSKEYKGTD